MTTLLSRQDVERLLPPQECIAAVEDAFRKLAQGKIPPPGILGMHAGDGSFHVKAGFLTLDRSYFAAKLNANFPQNSADAKTIHEFRLGLTWAFSYRNDS